MSNITKHETQTSVAVVEEKTLVSYLDAMGLTAKLTEQEKTQYLQIAKASNLNPFKREIYATKYGENLSIITGYEVYIKRAERTGLLNGWKVDISGSVAEGDLRAKITIYRKDQEIPFEWEVWYAEYVQTTWKNGAKVPNKMWDEKPITMIKKVSISQGFRLCFSDELGGMPYTAEEMGTEQTFDTQYQEVNEPQPEHSGFAKKAAWVKEPQKKQPAPEPEPETVEAETVPDQPPAEPMTKGQREILMPLLSSPFLSDDEKERGKANIETYDKAKAEKSIKSLMALIKKRKEEQKV